MPLFFDVLAAEQRNCFCRWRCLFSVGPSEDELEWEDGGVQVFVKSKMIGFRTLLPFFDLWRWDVDDA